MTPPEICVSSAELSFYWQEGEILLQPPAPCTQTYTHLNHGINFQGCCPTSSLSVTQMVLVIKSVVTSIITVAKCSTFGDTPRSSGTGVVSTPGRIGSPSILSFRAGYVLPSAFAYGHIHNRQALLFYEGFMAVTWFRFTSYNMAHFQQWNCWAVDWTPWQV